MRPRPQRSFPHKGLPPSQTQGALYPTQVQNLLSRHLLHWENASQICWRDRGLVRAGPRRKPFISVLSPLTSPTSNCTPWSPNPAHPQLHPGRWGSLSQPGLGFLELKISSNRGMYSTPSFTVGWCLPGAVSPPPPMAGMGLRSDPPMGWKAGPTADAQETALGDPHAFAHPVPSVLCDLSPSLMFGPFFANAAIRQPSFLVRGKSRLLGVSTFRHLVGRTGARK